MRMKKGLSIILATAMVITGFAVSDTDAVAKKKVSLSKKQISLKVRETKSLKIKNVSKKAKITWKNSKTKIVRLRKLSKTSCKLTGLKKGNAVITCKVKAGSSKKYTCKVKVVAASGSPLQTTPTPVPDNSTPKATQAPTATPEPTAVPTPEGYGETIKGTYANDFEHLGVCANYGNGQLQEGYILDYIKKQYNSVTLENEMKPEGILRNDNISIEEAKELGYVIPDSYKDATVPRLNFDTVDATIESLKENGLQMRAHTLVWHSQTPGWFFTKDYSNESVTTPEVMDGRLEFYIRSVMKHVMEKEKSLGSEPGDIVYCWDVVNEYLHRSNNGKIWDSVYGNNGLTPSYVKKAFEFAYDMVKQYGVENKVTLLYNDYDTYFEVDDVVELVNFINDGENAKICNGIGMQSHVDIDRPLIEEYEHALKTFIETGLEVQITELDVTINWDHLKTYDYKNEKQTDADQAAFVKDFMKMIVLCQKNRDKKVAPKGLTAVTIWGLYDQMSWRSRSKPLFNTASMTAGVVKEIKNKPSFDELLKAQKWFIDGYTGE